MAFVKIESKTSETEFIVFPSLYEQENSKLAIDNIIKVTGRVNARDKDGNLSSEIKIIADSISVVSDDKLENYQPTGVKLEAPKEAPKKEFKHKKSTIAPEQTPRASSPKPQKETKTQSPPKKAQSQPRSQSDPTTSKNTEETVRRVVSAPIDPRTQKLFVLIENPEDTTKLTRIRELCDQNPGFQEIILVLKDESGKKPLRMPFRIDASSDLIDPLKSLVGEHNVMC